MDPGNTMHWITRETELRNLAFRVLGADPDDDPSRVRYAFHLRMLACHPDRHPELDGARDFAALANEAFAFVSGKRPDCPMLQDSPLVDAYFRHLDEGGAGPLQAPTYEEWLRSQFVNMDGKSIWAY